MIDPAILRALQAAGATADMIIAAVEAAHASEMAKKEAKRAGNAERQRRFKAKRKVTANNADNALPSVTPSPNDIYSNPQPVEPVSPSGDTPPCRFSVEDAIAAYNETAGPLGLPKAKSGDGARAKNIRARLNAAGEAGWREALAALERSKFCRGENDRGFRADIDFVAQPKSFNRLREGFYGSDADAPGKVVQLDPEARAAELLRRAEFKRSIGQHDDARDLERDAARCRGPTSIGDLVRRAH